MAAEYIRREVKPLGYTIPYVRLSVGFPLGLRGPKAPLQQGQQQKSIASQCFEPGSTEDGIAQIFINPLYDNSEAVLTHLTHELAHVTSQDPSHVIAGPYDQLRKKWGLVGRATAPVKNQWLDGVFQNVLVAIGPYEDVHAKVIVSPTGGKKQATFMKRVFCRCCGDLERRTKTHIEKLKEAIALGAPSCRKCFVGHPDCTGLCKQPPPPPSGGNQPPPPPQEDFDATPQPPPPASSPNGSGEQGEQGDGSDEDSGGDEEGEDGDGDDGDGDDESDSSSKQPGQGIGGGAGTATQAPAAKVVMSKAGGTWNAVVHRKDLCPFGSGCPQCEGDY